MSRVSCVMLIISCFVSCKTYNNTINSRIISSSLKIGEILKPIVLCEQTGTEKKVNFLDNNIRLLCVLSNQCSSCSKANITMWKRIVDKIELEPIGILINRNIGYKFETGNYPFTFYYLDEKINDGNKQLLNEKRGDFTLLCKGGKILFIKHELLDMQDYLWMKDLIGLRKE